MLEEIVSDDHSYSSSMSGTATVPVGGGMSARSFRRPGQNSNNRTATAVFNDESDRSASSSSSARTAWTGSNVSTNNNNAGCGTAGGKVPATTSNAGQSSTSTGDNIQELKKSLTLDFTNPENAKKALQRQTPELFSFLRLTSPELEKFLTQGFTQGSSVVQTPTPTQFFFPKDVTVEQEQYARGFLDALNHIYQRSGFVPVNNNILSPGFVANTVAQDAKDGPNKELPGPTTAPSTTSHLPGPPTSSVSLNAALVSTFLASFSAPSLSSNAASDPALVTAVGASELQQFRQPSASTTSSAPAHNSTAFCGGPIAFPSVGNSSALSNSTQASAQFVSKEQREELQVDQGDHDSPSVDTYDSRSSSVDSSSYPDHNSSFSDVDTTAAAALATMNRNAHPYGNFSGTGFMQPSTQQQFLALTNAAQLLRSGEGQQLEHHLASTSTSGASSSAVLTKMEICDDQGLPGRFMPGTMPLDPVAQERLKLERKRARNRVAATKCRRRKMERINVLEMEVDQIRECNRKLENRRDLLMEELRELRKFIEDHQKAKCNIGNIPPHSTISNFNFTGNRANISK